MSQVTVSSSHRDAEINEVQTGNATLGGGGEAASAARDGVGGHADAAPPGRLQPAPRLPRRGAELPSDGTALHKKSKGSILEEIEDDIDNNVIDDGKSKSGARVCVPRVRRRVRGGAGGRAGVGSGAGGAAGAAITGAGAGGAAGGTARAARAARRHPVATSPVTVHFQPLMHVRGMVVSGGRVRARGGGGRGAAGAGGVRGRVCGARAARRTGAAAGGARHAASARTGAARRGRGTRETVPGPEARARRALCVFFTLTLALAHFSLVFNK
ncbi:glycine-rich protein 1 isoform X11 [Bombyx mori]|uniref:glycine-rich protein 1 isoform X11 n=1 Tax=Bombyx mori TaxID=7091 RepID=UPI002ED641BB